MKEMTSQKRDLSLKLLEEFRRCGFDGLTMSEISKVTGLGKASLYHHFPGGKGEMAQAVLALATEFVHTEIVCVLESDEPPGQRIRRVARVLDEFYQSGKKSCVFDVLGIGEVPKPVRDRLRDLQLRMLAGFTKLGKDKGLTVRQAEDLAERSLIGVQGSLVLSRTLGDTSPFRRELGRLELAYAK